MRVFRVLWPLISLPMMLSFCYIYNATRSIRQHDVALSRKVRRNVCSGHHSGARYRVV